MIKLEHISKTFVGSVQIDGIELTTLAEKQLREVRTKIGMIFQHFNLMRSRTVYDLLPVKSI